MHAGAVCGRGTVTRCRFQESSTHWPPATGATGKSLPVSRHYDRQLNRLSEVVVMANLNLTYDYYRYTPA
jgi:hypothetical protein